MDHVFHLMRLIISKSLMHFAMPGSMVKRNLLPRKFSKL